MDSMELHRILIVEDDPALGQGIRIALQSERLAITVVRTLADARIALAGGDYALMLLDINLPDGSGLDFLLGLRQSSRMPVILITANDMETDIVVGLECGADDYITKPFSLAVLRARVHTQLRKIAVRETRIVIGAFVFDFERMEYRKDGVELILSRTEQKLLRLLVENRGRVLSRADLVDRIWTDGAEYVDENALSVTVKRLRDKLEECSSKPQYLKTVYGIGYTWEGK